MGFLSDYLETLGRVVTAPFKDDPIVTREEELKGRNAYNRAGLVVLNKGLKYRAAVWAQEAYEAELKLNLFEATALRLDKDKLRDMELLTHEIEVQAAKLVYEAEENSYRFQEAASLMNGYDGLFKGYTTALLNKAMRDEYGLEAKFWVRRNMDRIKAQVRQQ